MSTTAATEKTVVCVHNEVIKFISSDVGNRGTCSICGQIREYDFDGKLPPKLIKRGRIDGVLTDISPVVNRKSVQREVPSPPSEQAIQTLKPPNWDKMDRWAKSKWLEGHREEIIKDAGELGELQARKKCDIASPTWAGLKKRWGFGVSKKRASKATEKVPQRPEKKRIQADLEKNKEAIIKDYNTMPWPDLLKKWHFSCHIWARLQKEWGVPHKIHRGRITCLQQEFTLPEFPAFNDKWGDPVQVKWLEVYPELYREANAERTNRKT